MRRLHGADRRRQPTRSCITKVGTAAGKRIVTIEGLAPEGKLHPMQEAFLDADAHAVRLVHARHDSGRGRSAAARIRIRARPKSSTGMNGHICRCGTYPRVVAAIQAAARKGGRA